MMNSKDFLFWCLHFFDKKSATHKRTGFNSASVSDDQQLTK